MNRKNLKYLYLLICILGILLPYSQYYPFYLENGLGLDLLFKEQFSTNATRFFGFDLLVTVLAAIAFMLSEAKKLKMKKVWIPILSIFMIGLSFGFPLFFT